MQKGLTVPVLTALLLSVSVASVAAQHDAETKPADPLFVIVMDPNPDGSGQFTPFFELDGGSVEVIADLTDDRSIERVLRLDPAPPGGDSIDIRLTGSAVGLRGAVGLQMVELRWDILGGTGTFSDLTGGGSVVSAFEPGATPRISVYSGSTARAVPGSALAQQNWQAIQKRFKIKKLKKRGGDATFVQPSQTKPLKKLARQNKKDIDFLTTLGSEDCYAEAYDALLGTLRTLDRGLELKIGFDPAGDAIISSVHAGLETFDQAPTWPSADRAG